MTAIYGLVLLAGLLAGGGWGWLLTTEHHERVMAEQDQEELEITEFQEMYATWAMLHNNKPTNLGAGFPAKRKGGR